MRQLLGVVAPPEADVQAAWAEVVRAVEGWLTLADLPAAPPAPPPAGRREGFWK